MSQWLNFIKGLFGGEHASLSFAVGVASISAAAISGSFGYQSWKGRPYRTAKLIGILLIAAAALLLAFGLTMLVIGL